MKTHGSMGRSRLSLRPCRGLAGFTWLLTGTYLLAHGDLHEQIQEVSAQLLQQPARGELYLKRAELHRVHGNLNAAEADYDQAARLDPGLSGMDFGRGQLLLAAGKIPQALVVLDRFLSAHPGHGPAFVVRAKARSKAGDHLGAAADYTLALQSFPQPEPEYYSARAQALVEAGPEHIDKALAGLDEGLARLGGVLTLELLAVDLEISVKRYAGALTRIDRLRQTAGRPEFWWERRGDILDLAGRPAEARQAYHNALEAVQSRPARILKMSASQKLAERLRLKLTPAVSGKTKAD